MSNAPVTMQQIAAQAGVTAQTVANVLQGRTRGAWKSTAQRAERIRQIAEDLGYRPNAAARATKTGRFNCVCLVSSTHRHRSTLFSGLISGACDALAQQGMHLTFAQVEDEKLTSPQFLPKALTEWTSDGLLLNYTQKIPVALIDLIERYRIPTVWLNSQHAADCVYFDDAAAGAELTEHLLRLGHRRIAFVYYNSDGEQHYSVRYRAAGYESAMRSAGLQPRVITRRFRPPSLSDPGDSTAELSREWLQQPERPTAIVAYGPKEATASIHAAALLGLQVPHNLSVATFSDRIGDDSGVPLTRMWTNHHEMAGHAVQMLLSRIDDPTAVLPARQVPLHFWQGRSCQAPLHP